VTILWNGVPLEEYGVADALLAVTFTKTVGRTKASKMFKVGKPKVGGANLKFELTNKEVTQRLMRMVLTRSRPRITLGVGYDDSEMYWVGGFGTNKDELLRKKYQAIGFRLDAPVFRYGSAVPTMTLGGVSDKVLGLGERFKPRVYTDATIEQILQNVADDHGFILELDGMANRTARMSNLMSPSEESDLAFTNRVATMSGNAMVAFYADHMSTAGDELQPGALRKGYGPGAAKSVDFTVHGSKNPQPVQLWANRANTIMKIRKMPHYLDMGEMEQASTPILAYNMNPSDLPAGRSVIDAQSIQVSTKGYKAAPNLGAGVQKKNDDSQVNKHVFWSPAAILVKSPLPVPWIDAGVGIHLAQTQAEPIKNELDRRVVVKATEDMVGHQHYQLATPLPDEIDEGVLTSEFLRLVAEYNHFTWTLNATVVPGVPWLQAPLLVEVMGTDGHDGLYGIETSTLSWSASGLKNSLVLKPAGKFSDTKAVPKDTKAVPKKDGAASATDLWTWTATLASSEHKPEEVNVGVGIDLEAESSVRSEANKGRAGAAPRNLQDDSGAVGD